MDCKKTPENATFKSQQRNVHFLIQKEIFHGKSQEEVSDRG